MELPEQKELEQFIDQQLKKLPEREAPEGLMSNVFAAIAARENAPWWKQPFTSWPRNSQALLYTALSLLFVAAVYYAWRPAEAINVHAISERASSFAWMGRLVETLSSTAVGILRTLPWQWFVAVAVVLVSMYAACVATGFALYRITARQRAAA
jgi:hypothetical protein